MKPELRIKKLREDAVLPAYQTKDAAGMDLCACLEKSMILPAGGYAVVPTGLAIAVPAGYAAFIYARSGLAVKHGVTLRNAVGVVDADYRGEVRVGLQNLSDLPYEIGPGERIAQLVIMPAPQAEIVECAELDETSRGEGGFGSTGK